VGPTGGKGVATGLGEGEGVGLTVGSGVVVADDGAANEGWGGTTASLRPAEGKGVGLSVGTDVAVGSIVKIAAKSAVESFAAVEVATTTGREPLAETAELSGSLPETPRLMIVPRTNATSKPAHTKVAELLTPTGFIIGSGCAWRQWQTGSLAWLRE